VEAFQSPRHGDTRSLDDPLEFRGPMTEPVGILPCAVVTNVTGAEPFVGPGVELVSPALEIITPGE